MRNFVLSLAVLCSCIFLWGCPYSSEVPISKPSMALDSRMLGTFEQKNSEDTKYIVTKDGKEYKIEKKSKKSGDVTVYKGFLSDVGGTTFINIYENGSGSPSYYLYKVDFKTKGQVTLIGITENIKETFSSSEELKSFIEKYMNLSFFFDKSEDVFFKKG